MRTVLTFRALRNLIPRFDLRCVLPIVRIDPTLKANYLCNRSSPMSGAGEPGGEAAEDKKGAEEDEGDAAASAAVDTDSRGGDTNTEEEDTDEEEEVDPDLVNESNYCFVCQVRVRRSIGVRISKVTFEVVYAYSYYEVFSILIHSFSMLL